MKPADDRPLPQPAGFVLLWAGGVAAAVVVGYALKMAMNFLR